MYGNRSDNHPRRRGFTSHPDPDPGSTASAVSASGTPRYTAGMMFRKVCATCIYMLREHLKKDVEEHKSLLAMTNEELGKAETTVWEWHEPDMWHSIGYEPPVAGV